MENQQNKTNQQALLALRQEIDDVDNKIIELLKQRMQIINRVGDLKKNSNEKFFIRANREADMIKNLLLKADATFPKSAIVSIWRKIISAANMHEQSLKIALHNPKNISDYSYLLREYYYDAVPIQTHDSATNIVSELEKGEAQIGVFALPQALDNQDKSDISENWWISLANNKSGIKIFAKIPFVELENSSENNLNKINLVALAIKEAEQSSADNSLFYLEIKKEISRSQILAAFTEQGLKAVILKSTKLPQVDDVIFYLVELTGFYSEESAAIKNFSKSKIRPYTKFLGSYALPIKL
jgi:chorismate mutase